MHSVAAPSLLPALHCQPPRADFIVASSLRLSSMHSAVQQHCSVFLHSSPFALPIVGIASPLLLSSIRCMCREANFACFSLLFCTLFAFLLRHFFSHALLWRCIACSLAPFIFTATRSLFPAAVIALDTAISAARSALSVEFFAFSSLAPATVPFRTPFLHVLTLDCVCSALLCSAPAALPASLCCLRSNSPFRRHCGYTAAYSPVTQSNRQQRMQKAARLLNAWSLSDVPPRAASNCYAAPARSMPLALVCRFAAAHILLAACVADFRSHFLPHRAPLSTSVPRSHLHHG